ncbi:MAG: SPOR domain-containing protein [Parvibaculaceae bacterium]
MDQDSTRDGSPTGEKRNWRDRLGVNKGLPKLSDEFRPRESGPRGPGRDELAASETEKSAETGRSSLSRRPTPVERTAPMAPRIPPRPPVTAAGQEKRAEPGMRPMPPRGPEAPAAERETANRQPSANRLSMQTGRPGAQGRPAAGPRNPNDEFGERLRAQREAAERLVQQRLAAARQKAQEAPKPASNGDARQAQPAQPTAAEEKPRFSFADEEIAAAKRETPAPSAFAPISPPPYSPTNANYIRPARSAGEQPRAAEGFNRPSPSSYVPPRPEPAPFPAARPEPQNPYRQAAATAPLGAPEPRPMRGDAEAMRANRPNPRRPEVERRVPPRRGAHARELDYIEDDLEEVFEDERPARRPVSPRRAKASDYTAAYRGYDDDYEEDEPRSRSGPIILLLALLAVAAIAGGLIYWYKQQQQSATRAIDTGDVPVVTSPQEPVKATPEPESQQAIPQPQTPQGRKQIYDRILGEETLEPERIVPTEEQPQQQLPQAQQPPAQQQQIPPANQDPNAQQNQQGTEPLPLPLPPPPGTGEQGRIDNGTQQTTSRQVPEPASSNAIEDALKSERSAKQGTDLTETSSLPEEPQPNQALAEPKKPEPSAERKATDPAAKPRKQQTETARAANDTPQALQGTGPVQIAPAPLNQQPAQQQQPQAQQSFTFNPPPPQALQQAPDTTPRARRKRDVDPLEGSRTPFTGTFQSSQPEPIGKIASNEQGQQAVFQQAVQTQPAPQPQQTFQQPVQAQQQQRAQVQQQVQTPPQSQQQPQAQQQVAVANPQAPAPTEASGYVVQLASFRSEGEAQGEFQRLSQRHPGLVGNLRSRVERSDLGAAGTFYRLGVGPMATKEAATQFCSSLIAAGEKDCLVRRQ